MCVCGWVGGGDGYFGVFWPFSRYFLGSLAKLTTFWVYENSRYFWGIVRIEVRTFC